MYSSHRSRKEEADFNLLSKRTKLIKWSSGQSGAFTQIVNKQLKSSINNWLESCFKVCRQNHFTANIGDIRVVWNLGKGQTVQKENLMCIFLTAGRAQVESSDSVLEVDKPI